MDDTLRRLAQSGSLSLEKYREKVKQLQAAPAAAQAGKKAGAPLDIRPPAARNKPKPTHAKAQRKVTPHGVDRCAPQAKVNA